MSKKNILFVSGINDTSVVKIEKLNQNGLPNYVISGSSNLHTHLKNEWFDINFLLFDTQQNQEVVLPKVDVIFNQVSDADTHTVTLEKVESLHQYYGKSIPLFNKPENIRKTKRDSIYRLLQGIDRLHVPKTVQISANSPKDIYQSIKEENFSFPVIFRKAGDHGGVSTLRIDDENEAFHSYCLNGDAYYLTQFVDYKDKRGLYGKYRLVVVNGEVFIRHAIFGEEWMVHAGSQLNTIEGDHLKVSVSERFSTNIKPAIEPVITQIYERLGLDYFGIDCHIDDKMNLLVFEINANMNIFVKRDNSVFSEHIDKTRTALLDMLDVERR